MIRTPLCERLGIEHPILLGGMAGATSVPLVAAVSEAGGLGIHGATGVEAEALAGQIGAIRDATARPFGVNFLVFRMEEARLEAALAARPAVLAFAWAPHGYDLATLFGRAHSAGAAVVYQATEVGEAQRAAEAGADVIVAQGTEAGGHVGVMATLPLVPMMVDAVAPVPVVAAGGIADGRGLAAALALGAQGALLGTRLLATGESPLPPAFKQAIVASDGHDTALTDVLDLALGRVWPGAMARMRRNRLVERWLDRPWAARRHGGDVAAGIAEARSAGDVEEGLLYYGQDAGLVHDIPAVSDLVPRIAAEAEAIVRERLPAWVR